MPFVELSHGHVHYRKQGQGMPVLCLHANPGDSLDYAATTERLAEHYCVITLDWPGYGKSPMPSSPERITPNWLTDVLLNFMQALELEQAVLIGNSVGGYAASMLAIEHPERVAALVLVSPAGFTPHNVVTRFFCRFQGSQFALSPALLSRLYLRRDNPYTAAMQERARTLHTTADALRVYRALWRSFAEPHYDLRSQVARLTQPTLLFFGKFDPLVPALTDGRIASRLLPHAQLQITDTGHAMFAEEPENFLNIVKPFLAQVVETLATTAHAAI